MGRSHEQTTEIPFSPIRLAKILKFDNLLCYKECEKMGILTLLTGMQTGTILWKAM